MSIFRDLSGQSDAVFTDLFAISRQDGNLGDEPVPTDATVVQMTYDGAAPAPPTAARLHALVNNNFGAPIVTTENIVITAINGGNDPHSGMDVTGNGFSYLDETGDSPVIRNVYDVSNCNGQGIFVFDTDGDQITFPRVPLLYHELSHAFRAATDSQLPNDEPPAETDENVMRSALELCLRDINNHFGGCGSGDDCGGTSNGCFIVSATTGSSESAEVTSLRQLRDRVAGVSGLSAQLIDVIYDEYYQFSPGIAVELERDAVARTAVLWIVVRPLLAWYTLAGTLALEQTDPKAVTQAARDVLSACPGYLGGSSIAALLETIRSGEPLPTDAPQLLLNFAPRIREAAGLRFASWAILDPLVRAWTSITCHLDVVDQVAQWLATAPLEALAPPRDSERLDLELGALAGFFDFRPTARRQLGERLAGAWPDASVALARHGFIK